MLRLRQPSSRMVCFSGCVLHQSRRRYRRSVTCSASWLDSSTSSVEVEDPDAREMNLLMGGWRHLSGSSGLSLFGCGTALWAVPESTLLSGEGKSAATVQNISTEREHIVGPARKTDGFYAQRLRTNYAQSRTVCPKTLVFELPVCYQPPHPQGQSGQSVHTCSCGGPTAPEETFKCQNKNHPHPQTLSFWKKNSPRTLWMQINRLFGFRVHKQNHFDKIW